MQIYGHYRKFIKHNKHAKNLFRGVKIANNFVQSRGLEEDDSLFVRDLDAEELFGREYDLLDERDLEARNILGEAGSVKI